MDERDVLDQDIESLAAQLRAAETELPVEIVQRLQAARRRAVEVADVERSNVTWWPQWVGAGGAAAALLVVVLVLQTSQEIVPQLDDVEFAMAQDAELLEDLEFLAWIAVMEDGDERSNSG